MKLYAVALVLELRALVKEGLKYANPVSKIEYRAILFVNALSTTRESLVKMAGNAISYGTYVACISKMSSGFSSS
jgi:hypothetical protein